MEITNNALEKFKDRQTEVIDALLELLRLINELEQSIFERDSYINWKIRKKELTAAEIKTAFDGLWRDYREECKKIVEPRCTDKLLKKGYAQSFNNTPMYSYIDDPEDDCKGVFTMDSAKKAVVEFRFTKRTSVNFMHRFTLVPDGDKWLVDAFSYANEKEGGWHRGHI